MDVEIQYKISLTTEVYTFAEFIPLDKNIFNASFSFAETITYVFGDHFFAFFLLASYL